MTESAKLVDALGQRYGKLPSEILKMAPDEFYFNAVVAFPDIAKKARRAGEMKKKEQRIGYNPIRKLLDLFRNKK